MKTNKVCSDKESTIWNLKMFY